jgi:hypothetical protein
MKKLIYISGVISAVLMMAGCLMKIQHWPGSSLLLNVSILLFCLLFLPGALINNYNTREVKKGRALYIATYFTFSLGMLAILFKVEHIVGASALLILTMPLPFILFLPIYLYHIRKEKDNDNNMIGVMFGLIFIAVFGVLLAMNVSKDVLYAALENNSNNILYKNLNLERLHNYNPFDSNSRDATVLKFSKEDEIVVKESEHLYMCLGGLKEHLMKKTFNENIETTDPYSLLNADNTDVPKHILNDYRLGELNRVVNDFRIAVLSSAKLKPELKSLFIDLFGDKDQSMVWAQQQFSAYHLAFVLNQINLIQGNVKFIEAEIIAK